MTKEEFIAQFDIYYNSIDSNAAPSINNYEKSVFLTDAQKDIVIELYNGRNVAGLSFESTEEARVYLRELIAEKEYTSFETNIKLPEDCWFITLEECSYNSESECISKLSPTVVPVKQDDLNKILKNPFKGPSVNRVIRADVAGGIKLYSDKELKNYKITYIRKPYPIIVEEEQNLIDYGLKVDGKTKPFSETEVCELNPIIHRAILERAVRLAKIAYTVN